MDLFNEELGLVLEILDGFGVGGDSGFDFGAEHAEIRRRVRLFEQESLVFGLVVLFGGEELLGEGIEAVEVRHNLNY